MSRKFYLIPLSLILVIFVMAGIDRFSYTNLGEKYYNWYYNTSLDHEDKSDVSDMLKGCSISSCTDIFNKADLVVKCRTEGRKTITDSLFYTPVRVLKVYRGNQSLAGKQITLLEDIKINNYFKSLDSSYGYVPLQSGQDYVLCLNKKQWNPRKIPSKAESIQYFITSDSAFGVYRVSSRRQTKLYHYDSKKNTINSTMGADVLTDSPDILDQYYGLKSELFQKYKIS